MQPVSSTAATLESIEIILRDFTNMKTFVCQTIKFCKQLIPVVETRIELSTVSFPIILNHYRLPFHLPPSCQPHAAPPSLSSDSCPTGQHTRPDSLNRIHLSSYNAFKIRSGTVRRALARIKTVRQIFACSRGCSTVKLLRLQHMDTWSYSWARS